MKLNIHVNKPEISGYNNINLATQVIDFQNIDSLCEPAECVEILLDETLQYISIQQIPQILQRLLTRLRKNGKVIISCFDLSEIIKKYMNGIVSIIDLNHTLFGKDGIKRCSCFSYTEIVKILVECGLKINSIEINSGKFIIIAQRIN